jgi:hypothetical protein
MKLQILLIHSTKTQKEIRRKCHLKKKTLSRERASVHAARAAIFGNRFIELARVVYRLNDELAQIKEA